MQIRKNASWVTGFTPCLFRTVKITFLSRLARVLSQTADEDVDDYKPIYRLIKWEQIKKKVIKV